MARPQTPAQHKGSGMNGFVNSRNNVLDPENETLKLSIKGTKSKARDHGGRPNGTGQSPVMGVLATGSVTSASELKQSHNTQQVPRHNLQQTDQKDAESTDVGESGAESEDDEDSPSSPVEPALRQKAAAQPAARPFASGNVPGRELEPRLQGIEKYLDRTMAGEFDLTKPGVIAAPKQSWPIIKDDSYPPTTSGRPSTASVVSEPTLEDLQPATKQLNGQTGENVRQVQQVPAQNLPRTQRPKAVENVKPSIGQTVRPSGPSGPPQHGQQLTSVQASHAVGPAEHARRPPAGSMQPLRPSQIRLQYMPQQPANRRVDNQRRVVPEYAAVQQRGLQQEPPQRQLRADTYLGPNDGRHVRHAAALINDEMRAGADGGLAEEETDQFEGDHFPAGGNSGDRSPEQERMLDYEPPELYNMTFDELKSQSFDIDPYHRSRELPSVDEGKPLADRLETGRSLHREDQIGLFHSLDMNEWEEAGDWFLEHFSEALARFKEVRREKREAALQFELEVERRHDAVGRKRKEVQAALDDMRESGGRVLDRTPKKSKKI